MKVTWVGFTNPTTIFPRFERFYPFSILTKKQTLSGFGVNFPKQAGKKDKFRDKRRIKRIIFRKNREASRVGNVTNVEFYND